MEVYLNGACGLGDYLCTISLLTSVPEPVVAYANNKDNAFEQLTRLAKTLCIPRRQLKIVHRDGEGDFGGNYHLNILGNYYRTKMVHVNGKMLNLSQHRSNKRYIGFSCYNGLDKYIDDDYNVIKGQVKRGPANHPGDLRYRSLPYYAKIFELVRSWGYDIITLDHPHDLDFKIETLINNCEAVIGYEGGMGHLCSVLGIPYLMFDWRTDNTSRTYGEFQLETIHQSRTTFMIPNDEFLLRCSKTDFSHIIDQLNHGITNNRIVNNTVKIVFTNGVNSNLEFVDQQGEVIHRSTEPPWITQSAADFIHKFFPQRFPNIIE
jgi:hypothetical protein